MIFYFFSIPCLFDDSSNENIDYSNATLSPAIKRLLDLMTTTASSIDECCRSTFFGINNKEGYTILIIFSILSIIFSIGLIVCCFWSRCPLFNSCQLIYTRDEAGCAYDSYQQEWDHSNSVEEKGIKNREMYSITS